MNKRCMKMELLNTTTCICRIIITLQFYLIIVPSQLFPVDLVPVQLLLACLLLNVVHSNSRCLLLNVVQFNNTSKKYM